MRIDRLALTDFKNLIDFEVDFDVTSTRQVVVGRNGVGKSNLLESLTRIFRDLDLEEDSEFGYEIEYLCNGHFIKVQASRPILRIARVIQIFCANSSVSITSHLERLDPMNTLRRVIFSRGIVRKSTAKS